MHAFGTPDLHERRPPSDDGTPVAPPLERSTSWEFPSRSALRAANADAFPGRFYPRYGHSAALLAEARIATLEGAGGSVLYASGLAAISSLFLGLLKAGERIAIATRCYGGTVVFAREDLPRFGIEVDWFDPLARDDVARALAQRPRLVHIETPINPTARLLDVAVLASAAHDAGALLSVDATFCPPPFQRTLAHGADFALHSATKFLGGHTDVLAGVISGSVERIAPLERFRRRLGPVLGPDAAWLLVRSLETLEMRVRHQCATALTVARWLDGPGRRLGVTRVHYPGLEDHPDRALAQRTQSGLYGAVFAFELEGGLAAAERCFDRLQRFRRGVSLGGVESLVAMPCDSSHAKYDDADFERAGFARHALRLSIGVEPAAELIADLEQALGLSVDGEPAQVR